MKNIFEDYAMEVDEAQVSHLLQVVTREAQALMSKEVYVRCLNSVDYTTLNSTDTLALGRAFAERVNKFSTVYPAIGNVAAICVYPALVGAVRQSLTAPNVKIAAVGAGFPASQTYIDVKINECRRAIEEGADEIDIVISLCHFLAQDYDTTFEEVQKIKQALGKSHLKVILETGALPTLTQVRQASLLAMAADADFIKTSTGKMEPAATPQAAIVMCQAIQEFYAKTGKRVGFKPAGGVSTTPQAVLYYAIVKHILGDDWLNADYFRIGASRLANHLLGNITTKTETYF
ncbi:deoxyribose-phosphate aldolase [Bacteroidia bacterium]|nr:deoxyribose-phosphate aldolase [Bacteroidia bacterium]